MAVIVLVALAIYVSRMDYMGCPNGDNYSPCTCSYGQVVYCKGKSLVEVRDAFSRTRAANLTEVHLEPYWTDEVIPADLFGGTSRQIGYIELVCSRESQSLKVDPDAFRSVRNGTTRLAIQGCDTSRMNFTFLTGFNRLTQLWIYQSSGLRLSLPTLPSHLPSLSELFIYGCKGLNDWTKFPDLTRGLTTLKLHNNGLQDEAMDRILDWALDFSAETLQKLHIDRNALTVIPHQLTWFSRLTHLDIRDQDSTGIPSILEGSLSFPYPVRYLSMSEAKIATIEPGSFDGNMKLFMCAGFDKNTFLCYAVKVTLVRRLSILAKTC